MRPWVTLLSFSCLVTVVVLNWVFFGLTQASVVAASGVSGVALGYVVARSEQ